MLDIGILNIEFNILKLFRPGRFCSGVPCRCDAERFSDWDLELVWVLFLKAKRRDFLILTKLILSGIA
jgi:hypothetical protein